MGYVDHLLILVCIYIILAVSLNLIVGFTGLLNLGHAAFFGIGAYTSALLVLAGVPFFLAFAASFVVAGVAGLLIGIPCLRLRGDYLAIATLGFGEIIRTLMKQWQSLTRGPLGIPGIPKPELFLVFDTQLKYFVFAFVVAALVVWLVFLLLHSPFGRVLRAIREDELAAQAFGKNVVKYKLLALMLGAGFAGIAGSLYAHYITFIDPTSFTLVETILILSMIVLGGIGSLWGSIIGAIILVLLPEPLRFLSLPSSMVAALRQMMYALLLIIFMLYKPAGLFQERKHRVRHDVNS